MTNTLTQRCQEDAITRLRKKYDVYYHTFERQVGSNVWKDGKSRVMLSSNDYLGLTEHPRVIEAGKRALEQWGSSTTGARLANGSRTYHRDLEEQLAAFLGKEACSISAAGYLSCMAATQTFAQKGDLIIVDRNVHSALWAGIGLTQAKVERFAHNNPKDLAQVLAYEKPGMPKCVVLEGVYSMEGHIAPLPEIIQACRYQNCFLVLDDAHGFGVLGREGRGSADHWGVTDEVDIITGSFSKALSSTGGFVAGSSAVIEYLRTHSKQTLFSAALSPVQACCASAALTVLQDEPEHLERLWANTHRYKAILEGLSLDLWDSGTPAIPIVLGSKERAYRFWQKLLESGIFTVMSIAPAVPPGKDLIRTSISARHTDEDFEKIEAAMTYAAKSL